MLAFHVIALPGELSESDAEDTADEAPVRDQVLKLAAYDVRSADRSAQPGLLQDDPVVQGRGSAQRPRPLREARAREQLNAPVLNRPGQRGVLNLRTTSDSFSYSTTALKASCF